MIRLNINVIDRLRTADADALTESNQRAAVLTSIVSA